MTALTDDEKVALRNYMVWDSKRDVIRAEIKQKEKELADADQNAEFAWELIKYLVTCSCGGPWPCEDSVWPGMDTRFHRHVIPIVDETADA